MSNGVHGQWGTGVWATWAMGPMGNFHLKCQKDVMLSKRCQVVKRCQMSKNETPRLWRRLTKKWNWHNEVHTYWRQFWHHKWWSLKTLKMFIESIFLGNFDDLHIWHQNWHQYVWTSLCQFIFFVNLLHSPDVWLFDIWHLFDNLTFWHI